MTADVRLHRVSDGRSVSEAATMPLPAVLGPHVRSWIGFTETGAATCRRRELPGPHVVMVFEFGPPLRISRCGSEVCTIQHRGGFVAGLYDSFATTEHDGHDASVQVNLTPLGARALLGRPLGEISRTVVALPDLLPAARSLPDRLASATSWAERFRVVAGALIERLGHGFQLRSDIVWAAEQIDAAGGLAAVGALARTLQMSRKHLNALFRDHVGTSPKRYASLVRFDRLAARIRLSPDRAWADLAAESGFADQAHMARDVRRFSGMSPTALRAYLADASGVCPEDAFPDVGVHDDAALVAR